MAADLTTSDALDGVAEDERCDDVEKTHQGRQNAGCDDDAPKGKTQGTNARSTLVEIAQDVETQHNHCHAEEDKTGLDAEHWPVSREV